MKMRRRIEPKKSAYAVAAFATFITMTIIVLPEVSFRASLDGLRVWWEIVFPALLPFFIASEVLMGLGVVHFIGALLEPLMRPLFGVPGVGAFALAMGLASGYPIGARITSRLRREGLCTQEEAERLVSFTNTADPLFMVGAVAVGMFHMPELGPVIAASHYISAIILGFIMKFYGRQNSGERPDTRRQGESLLSRAAHELYTARKTDNRSFGQIFGDAIKESVNTLLLIGGCIMMFSVVVRVLDVFKVTQILAKPVAILLSPLGISKELVDPAVSGFFEITIGSEMASRATAPIVQRVVITSAIIAWSGLSVLAQVAAMLFGTDVKLLPYCCARMVHAVIAGITAYVLQTVGPFAASTPTMAQPGSFAPPSFFAIMWNSCLWVTQATALAALAAIGIALVARPRVTGFRVRKTTNRP